MPEPHYLVVTGPYAGAKVEQVSRRWCRHQRARSMAYRVVDGKLAGMLIAVAVEHVRQIKETQEVASYA